MCKKYVNRVFVCCLSVVWLQCSIAHDVVDENVDMASMTMQYDYDNPKELLLEARQTLEEAEKLAAQIIEAARLEAENIKNVKLMNKNNITLEQIQNELISVEIINQPLRKALLKIMPYGWRVMIDMDSAKLDDQRIDFIAEKTRDQAIDDLTQSLGLRYQYYHQLTDNNGHPSPLLVVTENI